MTSTRSICPIAGELFDLDMNGAGMICITERETSVMLIDCEKMIKVWTLRDAQGGANIRFFRDVVHDNKLWATAARRVECTRREYVADKSKCFHFTTLQTQPWQPFPEILRYEPHPDGEVWFNLERAADKAASRSSRRQAPSRRYAEMSIATAAARPARESFRRQQRRIDVHRAARLRSLPRKTGLAACSTTAPTSARTAGNEDRRPARLPTGPP